MIFKKKQEAPLTTAQVVEAINTSPLVDKRKIYDIILSECFHSLSFDDVTASFSELPKEVQEDFAIEASTLERSQFHTWLSKTMVKLISKRLFEESRTDFDIGINKIGLWMEKNRNSLISNIAKMSKK